MTLTARGPMVATAPEAVDRSKLTPGSSGWTCADLDRPEVARQWHDARVELVHGVVSEMPSPMFAHGTPLAKLAQCVGVYLDERESAGKVAVGEVDLQVSSTTRYKADGVVMMPEDLLRQQRQQALHRPHDHPLGVLIVPPTVVIESISRGHESHDRVEKFRDYAAFGVANYWVVDAYRKAFDAWTLVDGQYQVEFALLETGTATDRKSTRLNSSHYS